LNLDNLDILLHKPESIAANDASELKDILHDYPYFQSIRSLYLKSLFLQKSSHYNQELKRTAAYTLDRDILFEFIISPDFVSYKPIELPSDIADIPQEETEDKSIEEEVLLNTPKETSTAIKSLLQSITLLENEKEEEQESVQVEKQQLVEENIIDEATCIEAPEHLEVIEIQENIDEKDNHQKLEEKLEIGKPLTFSENEKFSFQEWLQLAKAKPIEREKEDILTDTEVIIDTDKQKKLDLIDKFIETNPKILPTKKTTSAPVNIENSVQENNSLMTETLAKIYLEQKKYQKAIQAYEILILKYPEKSSFFADQILDIKALQQHNS